MKKLCFETFWNCSKVFMCCKFRFLIRLRSQAYQPMMTTQFMVQSWCKLKVILDPDCWNQSRSPKKLYFLSRPEVIIDYKNCPCCCWITIVVHLPGWIASVSNWLLTFPFMLLVICNLREFEWKNIAGFRSPKFALPPRPMWTRDDHPFTVPMG